MRRQRIKITVEQYREVARMQEQMDILKKYVISHETLDKGVVASILRLPLRRESEVM